MNQIAAAIAADADIHELLAHAELSDGNVYACYLLSPDSRTPRCAIINADGMIVRSDLANVDVTCDGFREKSDFYVSHSSGRARTAAELGDLASMLGTAQRAANILNDRAA